MTTLGDMLYISPHDGGFWVRMAYKNKENTAMKHDSTMDKNDLIAGIEHGLKAARHGL